MPNFVIFKKNNITLTLLVVLSFTTHSNLQPNYLKLESSLAHAVHCLMHKASEDCSGFAGDTLVKTATGYKQIQKLTPGTLVVTFDENTGCLCKQPITSVTTTLTTKTLWLTLGDEPSTTICAGTTQTFYGYNPLTEICNLKKYIWFQSSALRDFSIFTNSGILPVRSIQNASKLTKLYLIEVAETHNFFVTHAEVLVHNNPFALPAIAEISAKAAMLVAAGAKLVLDAVTGKNKPKGEKGCNPESQNPKKPITETTTPPVNPEVGTTRAGGSPGGPDKPPKKDDDDKPNCKGECDNKTCKKVEETKDQQIETERLRAESEKARANQATEHAKQNRKDKLAAEKKNTHLEKEKARIEKQNQNTEAKIADLEKSKTQAEKLAKAAEAKLTAQASTITAKLTQIKEVLKECGKLIGRGTGFLLAATTFASTIRYCGEVANNWYNTSKDEKIAISEKARTELKEDLEKEKLVKIAAIEKSNKLAQEKDIDKQEILKLKTRLEDLERKQRG